MIPFRAVVDSLTLTDPDSGSIVDSLATVAVSKLGRFEIVGRRGTGGMGIVYEAIDRELGRRVALKLVRPQTELSSAQDRLRREAQTMAKLSHPNVVTVFDIGIVGDVVFIAMELVDGGTLRDHIGPEHPWRAQLAMLIAAGRGLAAAHAAGIIHRDFKPDNVLVSIDGIARVTDFGVAHDPSGGGEPSTGIAGTRAYMAPERFVGIADTASDQFAFCVSAIEVLGGRARRELPRRVHDALERGLRADPAARWPTMATLLAELESGVAKRRLLQFVVPILALSAIAIYVSRPHPTNRPPETWRPQLVAHASETFPAQELAVGNAGRRWVYAVDNHLWVQDDNGSRRAVPTNGIVIHHHEVGATGNIYITGPNGDHFETWSIAPDGSRRRILQRNRSYAATMSPNEDHVMIYSDKHTAVSMPLEVITLSTGATRAYPHESYDAEWSPDGNRIAAAVNEAIVVIELETGKTSTLTIGSLRDFDWFDAATLIVGSNGVDDFGGVISLVPVARPSAFRTVYRYPPFTSVHSIDARDRVVAVTTNSADTRVAILTLDAGQWRDVDTGMVMDYDLAGWTDDNTLVVNSQRGDKAHAVVAVTSDGIATVIDRSLAHASLVGGDQVWFSEFGMGMCLRYRGRLVGDKLTEKVSLGVSRGGCVDPRCAVDAPLCIALPSQDVSGDPVEIRRWDRTTGALGDVLLTSPWPRYKGESVAVSYDGGQLAISGPRYVTVHDLATKQARRFGELSDPQANYQWLVYGPRGELYATLVASRGYQIVRFEPDGTSHVMFSSSIRYIFGIRLTHDGTRLAIAYRDLASAFWRTGR